MIQSNKRTPFRQGVIDGAIFLPVLAPFSLLFGVFASDLNLNLLQVLGYSFGVFAGASQFASLSLVHDNAPIFIALLAGFTLNMRFFLYSATLGPHFHGLSLSRRLWCAYLLIDQNFLLADNEYARMTEWSPLEKSQYYLGVMVFVGVPWHIFTLLGFYTGALLPESINLAFALPLSFIALVMPALKTPAHWLAALVSITGTLLMRGLPYNIGLIISAFLAIFIAAQFEAWQARRTK